MTLSGSAIAAGILWNLSLATEFDVTHGVAWQGTILAPNANVTGLNHPQLNGQLIAASVPDSSWVINRVTYAGCLPEPPGPPDTTLTMQGLCIDANGALDMRLRNTGDQTRTVSWVDLTRRDAGSFAVPAHSDFFFYDRGGDGSSVSARRRERRRSRPTAPTPAAKARSPFSSSPKAKRPPARRGTSTSPTATTATCRTC